MDVNTLNTAVNIGVQDAYDTQIVKSVWSKNSMSNFTASDFQKENNICEKVYEAQGAEAYNRCYNAAVSSNTPSHNALVTKYAEALSKGYSKDFESFKRKTNTLSAVGDIAKGLIGNFLNKFGSENTSDSEGAYNYEQEPKNNTGLYVGIGLLTVIGIGTAIYFARRK